MNLSSSLMWKMEIPTGDSDVGNLPWIDQGSDYGLVTDVCLKRKICNYIDTVKEREEGFQIYIREGVPLHRSDREACRVPRVDKADEKELRKSNPGADVKLRDCICKNLYDNRIFGAVMMTFIKKFLNCGQLQGLVWLSFAKSLDSIVEQEIMIMCVAITVERKTKI